MFIWPGCSCWKEDAGWSGPQVWSSRTFCRLIKEHLHPTFLALATLGYFYPINNTQITANPKRQLSSFNLQQNPSNFTHPPQSTANHQPLQKRNQKEKEPSLMHIHNFCRRIKQGPIKTLLGGQSKDLGCCLKENPQVESSRSLWETYGAWDSHRLVWTNYYFVLPGESGDHYFCQRNRTGERFLQK